MNHLTVGILGGSFNPITTGHIHIANNALTMAQDSGNDAMIDEVWFMPCAGHTFGKELLSPELRIKMIKKAIGNLGHFRVCEYEVLNKSKGSTYETLTELSRTLRGFPIDFYYIIGSDNTQTMEKWINYEKLISEFKFIVMPRPGYEVADWARSKPHVVTAAQSMKDISSTMVRELAAKANYTEMRKYVFPAVADMIEENGFYLQQEHDRVDIKF